MNRVQIEITLGLVFVLISSFVLFDYASKEEARMLEYASSQEAQAIEVGAALFENNCSTCHGKNGEGVPGLCPPLSDVNFFKGRLTEVGWAGSLEDYIVATVSGGRLTSTRPQLYVGGGRPAMPAWSERYGGPLREDQIRNIARFILNWEATATGEVVLTQIEGEYDPNDPISRGKKVYVENGCGGCHTLGALSAGVVGPNLTQIGTTAATRVSDQTAEIYIQHSIIKPGAYVVEGFPENVMPNNFAEILTEDQITDLVIFLASYK
jgi:mono/diheme cytochrome c family protein